MHGILTTNINKRRGEKKTRRKKCQFFASAMYSSYHASISPEGGLEVGQDKPCDFFLEALCAQTDLFWRKMKINNMYGEI